jgi:hypothetical protein
MVPVILGLLAWHFILGGRQTVSGGQFLIVAALILGLAVATVILLFAVCNAVM